jgi:uncharacterized protein YlaI
MAFLRNPLVWYKRYVLKIYDVPASPASIIGRAGHVALEHFYQGVDKETATALGFEYLQRVPDFDINFGKAKSKAAQKKKRLSMEREYLQAVGFYLVRPPRHKVLGVEVMGVVKVEGLPLPLKAIADLVVESRAESGAVDIVDHKFVDSFSSSSTVKSIFLLQAMFNYYTVRALFNRPVRRFLVYECKKRKNTKGGSQLKRHVFDFKDIEREFEVFHRLIRDATAELARKRIYLPNPSDLFEGDHSFDMYRLGLIDEYGDVEEV